MTHDHAGLMIIRAWVEPGSTEPLRARIRVSSDVSPGHERTLVLSRADDVVAAVQEWLAAISDAAPDPTEPTDQGGHAVTPRAG